MGSEDGKGSWMAWGLMIACDLEMAWGLTMAWDLEIAWDLKMA